MRPILSAARLWTLIAAGLCGCAAPTVRIEHVLPGAIPVIEGAVAYEVGEFTLDGGSRAGDPSAFVRSELTRRLEASSAPAATRPGDVVTVTGAVRTDLSDTRGTRKLRRWSPAGGETRLEEVPSLVRRAEVAVDFAIAREGLGQPVIVETRRSYTSTADPEVRGELGLGRPDAPDRVPTPDTIIRRLLGGCVDTFVDMLDPVKVTRDVQLRGTLSGPGSAGLHAVQRGDLTAAIWHLTEAVDQNRDDPNLLFDLAAVYEADGQLHRAHEHYVRLANMTDGRDAAAVEGARRTRLVMMYLAHAGK